MEFQVTSREFNRNSAKIREEFAVLRLSEDLKTRTYSL